MESNEIKKALLDSYEILNNKKINDANFDKTIQGTIIDCKDPSIGRYLIRYQDSTIEAYSVSPSVNYPKGNLVYISVPQGDMKNQKTILGTTKQLGTNYIEDLIQEDTFDTTKNLLQTDLKIELSSYETKESILDEVEFTKAIQNQIRNANFLKIKGKVRTNLDVQQRQGGRYGLKITLIIRNNATGIEEEQDYYFDSNNFTGNPYNYMTEMTQEVSYPLDGNNFIKVKNISSFVQGFPLQEEGKETDIFLSNISINGSYKLSDAEKATVGIVLQAPYGYTFTESSEVNESTVRPIIANIRAKGKLVDLNRQNVEIYWFKADPRITSTHEDYLKYGGSGWKCINPEKLSASSIDIPLSMVQYNQKNLFKCVAVYDNKTFSKEFTIYNYGAQYEVSIESTQGVNFAYSTGHPNLICHVFKNGEEINDELKIRYQWKSINSQNVNQDLNDTDMSQYYNKLQQMKDIQEIVNSNSEVYWNTIISEEDLTYLQKYQQLKEAVSNFENSQRVEGNTIYNLNLYKIIDYTTFYCSCFNEDNNLIGVGKIVIYNQAASLSGYNLVINNGDQVFLYDQNGMSLQSAAIDQPYNISDLSYTLSYNGVPIKEQELNFAIPTWKIPLKNTMIETNIDSNDDYLYIKGQPTLSFDVSNKYNVSNSNNDIYLILQYNDQTFTTKTNFTFNKQGGNGTNGTKYQFKITPEKDVLYFNANGEYIDDDDKKITITPHIWYNGVQQKQINPNSVSWDILINKIGSEHWSNLAEIDPSSKSAIVDNTGTFEIQDMKDSGQDGNLANIIKGTTRINNLNYYATVPLSTIFYHFDDPTIKVEIPNNSGFKYVTYSNDGTNPSYNELNPFEIDIYKYFGSQKEDISNKQSENFVYEWKILPQETEVLDIISINNNKAVIKPKDNFSKNGNQVTNAVLIKVFKNQIDIVEETNPQTGVVEQKEKVTKVPFATIHIPIHMMLNRYENVALNDWDGNTIEIDNEGGYILTPQVGAGFKEDNKFTGVLLGTERTINGDQTGLLGYAAGARSIFLDANTGNATFGLPDKGQIKIDVEKQATIRSGDYPNAGMQIQFSKNPHIRFGSGNFYVTSEGYIHAGGGGDIAGWNVSDDSLSKGGVKISSNNKNDVNPEEIDNTKKAIEVIDENSKDIFSVDYRGYLHSEQGDIAGWTIEPDRLFKDNVGMASTGEHAFWAGDSFYVNHNGYLFSKDGSIGSWTIQDDKIVKLKTFKNKDSIALVGMSPGKYTLSETHKNLCFWSGKISNDDSYKINFYVNDDGYLYSRYGKIGNWYIGDGGLYSDGTSSVVVEYENIYKWDTEKGKWISEIDTTKKKQRVTNQLIIGQDYNYATSKGGIYLGSDGIRFGSAFHVDPSGMYALAGEIGGIRITQSGLHSDNWNIDGSGTAHFQNAYINGSRLDNAKSISGSTGGGGISGGGMRMGSGGAGSSYMNPGVRTSPNGQTWDQYINEKIEKAINNLTRDKIINALQDGNYTINFGNYQIRANELSAVASITAGDNIYAENVYAGGKLATESYVDNAIQQNIPKS